MAASMQIKKKYAFIAESAMPAAVVDIEKKEAIHLSPGAINVLSATQSADEAKNVLISFLNAKKSKVSEWVKEIYGNGISERLYMFKNRVIHISATIPNTNQANILLLQFYPAQSEKQSSSHSWIKVIDHLPEGVVIHKSGKIVHMNKTARNLFGVSVYQGNKTDFLSLFSGEVKQIMKSRLEQWKKGNTTEYQELEIKRGKDNPLYLGEETVFITQDEGVFCQSVFTNLSIRKQWIHEKMRAQLAEEINQILKHEIKEHKITQEELEKARNLNLSIIESSRDMIVAEDHEARISVFNRAAEKEFGYDRSEVIGQRSQVLFKDLNEYTRVRKMLKKQELFSIEIINKRKNGELFTAVLSASKLFSQDGKYLGSMGVSRDVSKEKEAAEKLRRSEELYRDLFDNMSDAYLLLNDKGYVTHWNEAALKLLKLPKTKASKFNLFDKIHENDLARVKKLREQMIKKGTPITGLEYNIYNSKDHYRCVQVNSSPIFEEGKFKGSRELMRDVSEQKKAQAEAQEQYAKMNSFIESSAYYIWSVDNNYKLTAFNSNFARLYRRIAQKEPKLGHKVFGLSQLRNNEERDFWKRKMEIGFAGKQQNFEVKIPEGTGQKWLDVVLNPVKTDNGKIQELSAIAHSITFKKQAEGKIKEQTAKINSIFDSTAMLIYTLDKKMRITSYNVNFGRMLQKFFGVEIQIGQDVLSVINPFVQDELRDKVKQFHLKAFEGHSVQFEGPLKKKNGQVFWMETFLNPIYKDDGSVAEISCMAHEITDKKIIEKQMRESLQEKEILLQEVHHRVKNNLQVISSILNLQSSYVKDPNTLNILRESQNRIKSMSFIHESLYQTNDFSSIDFSDYILSLSKSLVHSYSINAGLVELKTNFEKVFLNLDQAIPCGLIVNELVSNALKYAFPDHSRGVISMAINEKEKQVQLMIKDNGIGMPEDFDFDKNDSLGLQLVFTLIEQLDGEVAFTTKPKQGTEYLITFDKLN